MITERVELMHTVSKCETEINFLLSQEITHKQSLTGLKSSISEDEEKIRQQKISASSQIPKM